MIAVSVHDASYSDCQVEIGSHLAPSLLLYAARVAFVPMNSDLIRR